MINEKNDLTYLRVDKAKGSDSEDIKAWELALDTYYKEFGLSDEYDILLELKLDLAVVHNDFAISGNLFLQNKMRHLQESIDEIINRKVDGNLSSAINSISKWCGFRINQKEVSTNEFFSLLGDFKKEVQALKSNNHNK